MKIDDSGKVITDSLNNEAEYSFNCPDGVVRTLSGLDWKCSFMGEDGKFYTWRETKIALEEKIALLRVV